jgi:acyl-CoA dehydrogenase
VTDVVAVPPLRSPLLSEAHEEFQTVCRRFVRERVLPLVNAAEEKQTFPDQLWRQLGEAGMLGLSYPEEVGGTGGDYLSIAILSEELAKASGGLAVTPLVSSYMAAPHLYRFGTPQQQERYLRPLLSGEQVAAIAVTEPGAGSDVAGISLRATRDGDGYRLQGTKLFITNGGIADVVLVAAKTGAGDGHRSITMFIVERDQAGFTVGRPLRKMGWHSSDTRELIFEDCFVPDDRILGQVDRGFYQIMEAFQGERIVLAAMGVGLAEACLTAALDYARQRQAFGKPIGSLQAIRHTLAEMRTETEAARALTYQAAVLTDSGADAADAVAMAKLHAARAANHVADQAVQIFGGAGFLEETPVAMHYRDARVLRIGGGSDEIQLEILAKRMNL